MASARSEQIGEAVAQSVSHLPGIDTEAVKQMFLAMTGTLQNHEKRPDNQWTALCVGQIAGFLLGAKSGGAGVNTGNGYELEAIAACTIGGVSVNGGIGRISGVIIGVLVFEFLKTCLQFLGIDPNYQYIAQGIVIVVAIALDIRKYIAKK